MPAICTTPAARDKLIADLVAAQHPRDKATMIVDLSFQAVDQAVDAFDRVVALSSKVGAGVFVQTLLIGRQLAAAEFEARNAVAIEFAKAESAKAGMETIRLNISTEEKGT